jgi:hypothetical protein
MLMYSSVDKIIISQNSLEAFITTVDPRAYASMTKVNFKALDNYIIKPVGVYGSKEEIVRFLSELGVVDDAMYVLRLDALRILVIPTADNASLAVRLGFFLILIRLVRQSRRCGQACISSEPSNKLATLNRSFYYIGPSQERGTTLRLLQFVAIV